MVGPSLTPHSSNSGAAATSSRIPHPTHNQELRLMKLPMNISMIAGAALVSVLTGCMDYADGPQRSYIQSGRVYHRAPRMTDNYVYYPDHQIYYSSQRRHYVYQDGNTWVTRSSPRISSQLLMTSPTVQLDFRDSPQAHHATVVRRYPKQGPSAGPSQKPGRGPRQDRSDDDGDRHH